MAGDLSVSFEALSDGSTRLSALAASMPERAQAWCEDVGSPAVAAAVEEWALWFSTEFMLGRGELEGLAMRVRGVVDAMGQADAELARVLS
ncbi:hypothetical protein [Oerskovia turbata]